MTRRACLVFPTADEAGSGRKPFNVTERSSILRLTVRQYEGRSAMHTLLFFVRCLPDQKMKCFYRILFAVSSVVVIMLSGAVRAGAEEEKLPDTFGIRLGGYAIENADTIVRLDAANAPVGTYIDFHDTLGGDTRSTIVRLDGFYRFNDHHALGFSWYNVKFTGSRVLGEDINWGDNTYPINTQVDSTLKFDVYKLNYQYSLYHNEKVELGAVFGFHIMRVYASISASGINQAQSTAVTAPLPVWGIFADYKFTPRFSVYYNYQVFFIDYEDKAKGGIQDTLVGLEYRLFRNFALGAAYNRFNLNLELKGDRTTLFADTGWNGAMLYGALYF